MTSYKTLYLKAKDWLKDEIETQDEQLFETSEDDKDYCIFIGRTECAESLLNQMKKWEKK